ncbi:MAG TPA: hypothetical protein VH157_02900, partial [Bryobacteraceae bacterium]|nr:hypothetical protein [Bryobacteraceae bacterium]
MLYPVVALLSMSLALNSQPQNAKAEKPAAQDSQDKNRITLDVSRVNMLFTVSDKKGRFIT